ncbi:MAG TPA: SAM-dependent methyltransferase, partial [Acidimicrobiales bacterium]|nr:SAM-dependent methyltransferase [Acidimicrobiales bacterium]
RYLLVERSEVLRARQAMQLSVEPAAHVLGPVGPGDDDDDAGSRPLPGGGPRVASLPDLPAAPVVGVVVANELLDNLAFGLLERAEDGWREVRVSGDLDEVLVPAAPALAAHAERLVPGAAPGARIPVQRRAAGWLWNALHVVDRGRVVVVDYAVAATAELAGRPQHEWLRTYRRGARGADPLDRPGSQDITVQICLDQLSLVAAPSSVRSQRDFLRAHGIDDLVREAAREWRQGAAGGSLAAIRARSRVSEAEALTDPSGLGAHRVVEWIV